MHEPRRRSALFGRHFSAPTARGTRTAQACSSLTGREFFAEIQRGIRRLRTAGTCRAPRRGQKGRTTYGFPSSLNSCLSLRGHGEICRAETRKGAAEDFSFRVFLNCFAVPDTGLLHRRVNQRWVRHNSAAQTLNVLCWKAPTQLSGGECLNSQVPCVVTG